MLPLSLTYISAVTLSGSPSSLNFDLEIGKEECLIFNIFSDDYSGDLTSLMKWADKNVEVTHPRQFNLTSDDINLNINYSPEEIENFDGQEEIKVCISGDEIGTWKGSLEYRTESSGGVGVGVGVGTWLRVNISEKPEPIIENPSAPADAGNSGGGSSGGGGSFIPPKNITQTINSTNNTQATTKFNADLASDNSEVSSNETNESQQNQNAPITGAVIGSGKRTTGIAIAFVVLLIGITISLYIKRKNKIIGKI